MESDKKESMRINVTLPKELISRIDEIRGDDISRSKFIKMSAEAAVKRLEERGQQLTIADAIFRDLN